jgi:hypothetical protein
MPRGTKVDKMYRAMRREGMDKGKAARIAQAKTGKSLATGRKPKGKMTSKHSMMRKGYMGGVLLAHD